MKSHLSLLLLLAIPALSLHASAAQEFTVTDANDTNPIDTIIFTDRDEFTVVSSTGIVVSKGLYYRDGTNGLILTMPGGTTTPTNNDDHSSNPQYDTAILGSIFSKAEEGNGSTTLTTSPLMVGQTIPENTTVTDNGTSIVIVSDSNVDLESLLHNNLGGTIVLGPGSGGNNNSGNGTGNPSGPPGNSGGNPSTVPEPSTWAMLICSLAGLMIFQRFRFGRRS
jgi:hypothetical protein